MSVRRAYIVTAGLVVALTSFVEPTPAEPFVYASASEGVAVVDAATNTVVDTYPVGASAGLALSADGRSLYVGSAARQEPFQEAVLDARTGQVSAMFSVPGVAYDISSERGGSRLWVSHRAYCTGQGPCIGISGITVVDATSYEVRAMVGDGYAPFFGRVALSSDAAIAYGLTYFGVVVIDTTTLAVIAERWAVCCASGSLVLHPNGQALYFLGNEFGGYVGVLDLRQPFDVASSFFLMRQNSSQFGAQYDIAFSPDGTRAYLPDSSRALFVLDSSDPWRPVLDRVIDLDTQPLRIAVARDGTRAYLANYEPSITVVELDSGHVLATIPLASRAEQIVIGPEAASADAVASGDGCQATAHRRETAWAVLLAVAAVFISCCRYGTRRARRRNERVRAG